MICPHCNNPIKYHKSEELKAKVIQLHKDGFSTRDIEAITNRQVSFSTAARIIKEHKKSGVAGE